MKLSELKTGERGVIVNVSGHGGFRKRIIEMGFVRGELVEVLLNAPLRDPVKYRIMGYELSLRHDEANLITVVSAEEAQRMEVANTPPGKHPIEEETHLTDEQIRAIAVRGSRTIRVALVGNPNCGKTSLFNIASGAHEHVGNYSGVTVDAKQGTFEHGGYTFQMTDLPGTYSLSAYSPEELYVRQQIINETPDIVINVIDSSNLERNLYLTSQLIDMNLRMVCALNMYDELERSGDKLDYKTLGQLIGAPMIPTSFKSGRGVAEMLDTIIDLFEDRTAEKTRVARHIHINHGIYIEQAIEAVKKELAKDQHIRHRYSLRYLSIKLLENDRQEEQMVRQLPNGSDIIAERDRQARVIQENLKEDSETAIMNAKYGFVSGALQETYVKNYDAQADSRQMTKLLDKVATNRIIGFPMFIFFLWLMFEVTFTLGQYPMNWIDALFGWIGSWISANLPEGPVHDMMVDGVVGGVGAVIIFLPQILILYFFISLMEDSGYMARAAFIMDKLMHKMGLHGKSFIPLIMGFGCNVPAIMATRTIESRKSRLLTMLVLPLMSCSARLPIYIMITGVFFAEHQSLVLISLYAIGIFLSIIMSRLFSRFVVRGEDMPFVMELPPYRFPTAKAIYRHTWEKGKQYLKKMGGIILVASVVVWFLSYYPSHDRYDTLREQQENSYLGRIGKAIEPLTSIQGFDWKLDIGILSGVGAKELVASTMGVLYSNSSSENFADGDPSAEELSSLSTKMQADGITPLTAFCYLLFILIYFPCIATIAAIKNESGHWKWALFTAVYTTLLAWLVSAAVSVVGQWIICH